MTTPPNIVEPLLVSRRVAAAMLGLRPDTLRRIEQRGIITPVRLGERGHPRYRVEDIRRIAAGDGASPP